MDEVNNRQVGGSHYRDGAGKCPQCGCEIQHWDIVHMFGFDYFLGVATKYIFRFGKKGDPAEQLEKSIHYLQKKLALIRSKKSPVSDDRIIHGDPFASRKA
jgi:hypothetical protein